MIFENGKLTSTDRALTRADFDQLAAQMGVTPGLAKKLGDKPVAAMEIVSVATPVVTINSEGTVQTQNIANPGDAILTRLTKEGTPKRNENGELDQWVVLAKDVEPLYNRLGGKTDFGDIVGGNNEVLFIELPNGGEIIAPWGGIQQISAGVLQYSLTTDEVYLNETDGFGTFVVERAIAPFADPQALPQVHQDRKPL